MKNLYRVALVAVLLCGCQVIAETPQKRNGADGHASHTEDDKRGTPGTPFVVETHAKQSEDDTADHAAQVAEQKRVNGWNTRLTFVIAVCAGLQFLGIVAQVLVYLKQTGIMKGPLASINTQATHMEGQLTEMRTANESSGKASVDTLAAIRRQADSMEEQHKTIKSRERARLVINIQDSEFGAFPLLKYKLSCFGTTPAYIVESWQSMSVIPVFDMPWGKHDYGGELYKLPPVVPTGDHDMEQFIHCSGSLITGYKEAEDEINRDTGGLRLGFGYVIPISSMTLTPFISPRFTASNHTRPIARMQ